jgi:hypothetical protein
VFLSQYPEPQSPSSQQYFAHVYVTGKHAYPALQNPVLPVPHGSHASALFGGGKHEKPLASKSHDSLFAASQPSFVTGLHWAPAPMITHEPTDGESTGASHAASGSGSGHFAAQSSAWQSDNACRAIEAASSSHSTVPSRHSMQFPVSTQAEIAEQHRSSRQAVHPFIAKTP